MSEVENQKRKRDGWTFRKAWSWWIQSDIPRDWLAKQRKAFHVPVKTRRQNSETPWKSKQYTIALNQSDEFIAMVDSYQAAWEIIRAEREFRLSEQKKRSDEIKKQTIQFENALRWINHLPSGVTLTAQVWPVTSQFLQWASVGDGDYSKLVPEFENSMPLFVACKINVTTSNLSPYDKSYTVTPTKSVVWDITCWHSSKAISVFPHTFTSDFTQAQSWARRFQLISYYNLSASALRERIEVDIVTQHLLYCAVCGVPLSFPSVIGNIISEYVALDLLHTW